MNRRWMPLTIGIVLLVIGGILVQRRVDNLQASRGRKTHVAELAIFVAGIYFLTKAVFPGEDDS